MEYLIRNGAVKEEVYLKGVTREKPRDLLGEWEYGRSPGRRRRKWKCVKDDSNQKPRGSVTATWVRDETQAKYFSSKKAAQKYIQGENKDEREDKDRKSVLRFAVVVEASV